MMSVFSFGLLIFGRDGDLFILRVFFFPSSRSMCLHPTDMLFMIVTRHPDWDIFYFQKRTAFFSP